MRVEDARWNRHSIPARSTTELTQIKNATSFGVALLVFGNALVARIKEPLLHVFIATNLWIVDINPVGFLIIRDLPNFFTLGGACLAKRQGFAAAHHVKRIQVFYSGAEELAQTVS